VLFRITLGFASLQRSADRALRAGRVSHVREARRAMSERRFAASRFTSDARIGEKQGAPPMLRTNHFRAAFAGVALLALAAPAAYAADDGVRVGTLQCHVEDGWGHVIASSRDMDCEFRPVDGRPERYSGDLRRYGLDIGYTSDARLIWAVFAPSSDVGRGALEGDYGGVSANATLGVGLGANALVGGFDRSIALQPLSVEGNTGLRAAAGVGVMTLRHG
jgi:hypothetical protein